MNNTNTTTTTTTTNFIKVCVDWPAVGATNSCTVENGFWLALLRAFGC